MTVLASVERYRGRNYIGASELRVQRTDRTSLRLGLDYNRYYSDGQINVLAAVSKGVPWWRDRVVKEYPGGPDIDAWVGNADISYMRSLKWQGRPVKYRVLWHGRKAGFSDMMKSLSAAYIPFADSAAPMYWQAVAVGIANRNGQVKSAGGNLLLGSI